MVERGLEAGLAVIRAGYCLHDSVITISRRLIPVGNLRLGAVMLLALGSGHPEFLCFGLSIPDGFGL